MDRVGYHLVDPGSRRVVAMDLSESELDPADIRNGWTPKTLEAYRAEREAAHRLTPGNVVTEFKRPRRAKVLYGAKHFNPHKW